MTISGRYVKTFAEASHALPSGMHMNADYPFMLPRITGIADGVVTISDNGKTTAFPIEILNHGRQVGHIEQSSSFESMYRKPPQRFVLCPFKDSDTPSFADSGKQGGISA